MEIPARHPRKGDCVIREVLSTSGRVKLSVDYPDLGTTRRPEFLDELVDRKTGQPISISAPEPVQPRTFSPPVSTPSWQMSRQTLLALRLGQSTADSVRDLSVGMAEIDAACRWALDRAATGQVSFLLFESPYGMGKSHALAHLRQRARAATMATGTVVLDGVGVSLCLPMTVVAALAHSIEFPDSTNADGLPQRLAGLIRTGETEKLNMSGCPMLFDVLRRVNASLADDPDAWEVLEDFLSLEVGAADVRRKLGLVVPALKARLADRPYRCAHLIREWAQACSVTGARNGLVIMLDEADVDYAQSGRTSNEREQREGLIRTWREIADIGPKAGGYARLVVAMAVTPGASASDPVEELRSELGPHLRTIPLREPSIEELRELGRRSGQLYLNAYELNASGTTATDNAIAASLAALKKLPEERNPRKFIRLLLEKLDGNFI